MEWGATVKIKLTQRYSTYLPGTVIECEDETAARLIRDGIAEREAQQDLFVETASVEPVAERADVTPRKRGRPLRAIPKPDDTDAPGG